MKKTIYKHKPIKQKWYIFVDGTNMVVSTTPSEFVGMKGVLLPITADEAATLLAIIAEKKIKEGED